MTNEQGCGVGVGVGRSRQIWPESKSVSESVKICQLRLRLACVDGSMVYVLGISIFTERQAPITII